MKKIVVALISIACLTGATIAFADDDEWYVLGAVGQVAGTNIQSTLDDALTSAGASGFRSSMNTPSAWNFAIGNQVLQNIAIEGGYIRIRNVSYSASGGNLLGNFSTTADISGWTLTAVGMLPLTKKFSLLGKLGFAGIQESANLTGPTGSFSINGTKTDLTYGIGAKISIKIGFSIRLSLDSYNIGTSYGSSRGSAWTAGIAYTF